MDVDLNFTLPAVRSVLEHDINSLKGSGSIASTADYAVCRGIMRQASNNYSSASRHLPVHKLHHVEALYAMMRVGDDRVDVSYNGFRSPLEALEDWEMTYWLAFERGDSPHPVMRAYLDTAIKFGISAETMSAYFRAMKEDLTVTRFPTFNHLLHYMDGSAITVGRAMTHILGVRHPYTLSDALPGADSLSIAMQLSNFWRDIGEDWRIGRVYLPLDDLQRFGYSLSDLEAQRIDERLIALLEFQFERTEEYYQRARLSVDMLDSGRWAVMMALEVYRALIGDIRAHGYNVFTRRAGTSNFQKIGLAIKAYWAVC